MTASIDAVGTSGEIKATYRRYLQSLLAVRDPDIDAALRRAIDTTQMLDKGPYLEATPPYAPGASCSDLIAEGVLAPGFAKLETDALPLGRPLYVHQERAIRKVAAGRNVLVATGTGSGKTESFLLPILDSLVREQERGELGPGVRALLLYPMNALANDQMKRLRQVLARYPQITFGRYTGDTQEDPRKARELFGELNIGEEILPNELLSRQEMRDRPPHLLLTNYAMLEYLLLRPRDMDLFATGSDSKWRFLVVDEAHVYDGSQGAEIAMLLRRVRDRVAQGRPLQCIATSATVGQDADPAAVARFATNLFGQPFEWEADDPDRQDLIAAKRVAAPPGPYWGPLSAADYLALQAAKDDEATLRHIMTSRGWDAADSDTIAEGLLAEQTLAELRRILAGGPRTFDDVTRQVFGDESDAAAALAAMVHLASSLRLPDGTTPISARYHLFLRATEGAFTCLSAKGPHVHLARHETCPDCSAPAFEIGSCKRCGAVHAVGTVTPEQGVLRLRPRKGGTRGTWLVLGEKAALTDEDEDAVADEGVDIDAQDAKLCTTCGAIEKPESAVCSACGSQELRGVRRLHQRGDEIAGCLVCGARGSGTVRLFETGADASGAVIATSLYQSLPPSDDPLDGQRPGQGRKLLAFSDSRQAAAYFAPYLDDSYARLQRRRLIAQGMLKAHADEEPVAVEDIVYTTRSSATAVKHFPGGMTAQQQARYVAPWVMAEVLATDDRQSLEGLGLVRIGLYRDPTWQAPRPLLELGLSPDETWWFVEELTRSLRQQGAVTMPEEVPPNHEIFAPRLGPIYARQSGPEPLRKVLSWLPGKGTNRRVDYVRRVLQRIDPIADPLALLEGVWTFLTAPHTPVDWLRPVGEQGLGVVHQIDHERLRLSWVTEDTPVFQCAVCRRIAPVSIRGVCPAIGCEGELRSFVPEPVDRDRDHYRAVYRSMHAVPLRAMEHTAQWANTAAADIQHKFVRGEINALSCSTTFELGVDVGELQAVLLRNMPPSTANYLQRAGRAGRRAGSAALVVTYAQRRSHDLTRFAEPEVMITGAVRAPYVPLANERIDRRHAHSVALSAFFRWLADTTGRIDRTAGQFFLETDGNAPSVDLVENYLTPVPPELTAALERIVPADVAAALDVAGGGWVSGLVALLATVQAELRADTRMLEELRDDAAATQKFNLAQRYQQVAETLRKRDLLGFLANRNVLPKYGFPVDSVELRTNFGYGKTAGANLDLTRDLSQAIYEYAPDATLVAGGQLWTSRGIYRLPGRDLVEYQYQVCKRCGGFRHGVAGVDAACPHCGEVASTVPRTLTIPEFGFVAGKEPEKPGPRPPQRSWSGAVHVLTSPPEVRERTIPLKGGQLDVAVGPRGRLIAVADGPAGMGFWICEWCGHGAARALLSNAAKPPTHNHLLRGQPCKGKQRLMDLAHSYETDLLTIDVDLPGFQGTQSAWKSVLYAVLEAACEVLEIARDDIGGSLSPVGPDEWSLVLFDAVSGGAGHVLQIEEHLDRVLHAALDRVTTCECGPETSCYGCLRSYSNQRDHDELSRGAAQQILRKLVDDAGLIDSAYSTTAADLPAEVLPGWEAAFRAASAEERALLAVLAEAGVPVPEVGYESAGGVPIAICWPERLAALDFDLDQADREDLSREGWVLIPIGREGPEWTSATGSRHG